MTAEQIEMIKALLPTALGSDEIRVAIASQILRQSVFSARMENARYLAQVQKVCAQVAGGGMNLADARMELTRALAAAGHDVANAKGITDPASVRRLNLIVTTRTAMAASAARVNAQTAATCYAFPAWELVRYEGRRVPRDWPARWKAAGDAVDNAAEVVSNAVDNAKSGCGSFIGGGLIVLVTVLGSAWIAKRK